jgi:hypothetical protein
LQLEHERLAAGTNPAERSQRIQQARLWRLFPVLIEASVSSFHLKNAVNRHSCTKSW